MLKILMKTEINIIEEKCDYLDDEINEEYDFSYAKYYNFQNQNAVIEIYPELLSFFGSPAKINNLLKSIKESITEY